MSFQTAQSFFVGSHQEPVITIRCTACGHLWREDEVVSNSDWTGKFQGLTPGG